MLKIAEAIGEFGKALTRGTDLASVTGDFSMHETRQFDWRVVLGEPG